VVRPCANSPEVRLLENPGNRGKGYSVRSGMLQARGDRCSHRRRPSAPIEEAERLFAAIQQGADIAIGSRWLQSDRQTQRQPLTANSLADASTPSPAFIMRLAYADTQCGFKLHPQLPRPSSSFKTIERWGFDPESCSSPSSAISGSSRSRHLAHDERSA